MKRATFVTAIALTLAAGGCKPSAEKKVSEQPTENADAPKEAQPLPTEPTPAPPDVAAPPSDAIKTASGLASKVLRPPTGPKKPRAWDKVQVLYTGWTTDGKMFDRSVDPASPAEFPLNQVIPGWTEGLQLMAHGEKRRFWVPEQLAYQGRPGAPAGMLVFDIELTGFTEMPAPPPVPEDVAAVPDTAKKTNTGLASRVLQKGTGTEHPGATDRVKVHYSGWTTDGKMFDSSVSRGEPVTFPLNRVIPGWTEGVQLMTVGEKRRFWIPEELAYKGRPGPQGTLVFDIELLDFLKKPETPVTPPDVAAPPKDAMKTASGLFYKVLKHGNGTKHPGENSIVEVHYSGWTTDGKMFDSTVARNQTGEFSLAQVINGWTEGVQLMVEGDTTRFWIPEDLAYKGQAGRPAGMLVFDIQLIRLVAY
jgi:peptidylprolyl isomerase